MKPTGIALAILCTVTSASGQTNPATRPQFDVTSVKPNMEEGQPVYGNAKGRGYGKDITLNLLIAWAWQVQRFQIIGGPAWISSDRFDVEGKTEDTKADFAQLRLMMRSLLQDRFKLAVHGETRESSVYQLVAAKGGPKITFSSDQISPDASGPPASPNDGPPRGGLLMGPGILIGNAITIAQFVKVLAPDVDRAVVDRTNLSGRFDIRLHWAPDIPGTSSPSVQPPASSEYPSSIFTAMNEQLGLKLQSARGPVEFLIIDHCEKPSPN